MIIAFKIELTFSIVVIKIKVISNIIDGLECLKLPYPNIVNILKVFKKGKMVYLIYECLSILLVNIQASPFGTLVEFKIAAVCKEVIWLFHLKLASNFKYR